MRREKLLLIMLFISVMSYGQVKIGDNASTINSNSLFEMESTDKGVLFPRVALTGTANASPLSAHVQGMVVFNTATTGDVTVGMYYNTGSVWVKMEAISVKAYASMVSTAIQQTTAVTTDQLVLFDTQEIANNVTVDLANEEFEILSDGDYKINLAVNYNGDIANIGLEIKVNGSSVANFGNDAFFAENANPGASAKHQMNSSFNTMQALSSGDVVTFYVYRLTTSGGTEDIASAHASIVKIN